MIKEIPGILLWCLEGLARLVKNNYRFSISEKSAQLKAQYMEDDNNIKSFLESEGYIEFKTDARCPTQVLYDTYAQWCLDNAEKAVATSTFSQYLKDNAEALNIRRNKNIPNNEGKRVRGYEGIRSIGDHEFRRFPDNYSTPFDD